MTSLNESIVENITSDYFAAVAIATKRGAEIDSSGERADYAGFILEGRLGAALHRLNPTLPLEQSEQVVRTVSRPPHPTLIQNNRWFHGLLTDGVEVEYREVSSGETRGTWAKL